MKSITSELVLEGELCVRSTSMGAEEEVGEVKLILRLLLRNGIREVMGFAEVRGFLEGEAPKG